MFFALSGFLVAGSYARCETVASFLFLRMIRIFPALAFETLISAFIIGPLFTTFTLPQYFTDHRFYSYFLNILGDVHYFLPGVFASNPSPNTVNGQLWTVPFELKCYILACVLSIFGIYKNGRYLFSAFVVLQIVMLQRAATYGEVSAAVPGNVLVLCFLAGFILFRIKGVLRVHFGFFLAAIAVHFLLYFVKFGDYCVALPDAYITIYLGTLNPPRLALLKHGDYSYGIYLYGFAIQQSVAALGQWTHDWRISLALSGPIIFLAAFVSWHVLEKRALQMKALVKHIDSRLKAARFPNSWLLIQERELGGAKP
jgi:peptidoglycan/LPS O-acetylase OafA/YrhL